MSKSKQKIKVENEKKSTNITTISADVKKDTTCLELAQKTNKLLEELAKSKKNTLEHCDSEHKDCGCDEKESKGAKTDLIVLIDTSSSVAPSARAVSDAVATAIKEASKLCDPDLQITYLGVDGTWPITVFTQSHRNYIYGIHGPITLSSNPPIDPTDWKPKEQGANAIKDLSVYAQWREGACRAIFYISDEELDGTNPRNDFANETATTNAAITQANANDVTVFAHHLTYQNLNSSIIDNYRDLTQSTGGQVYFSNAPDKKEYIKILKEVICNACGLCKKVKFPEIKPCISIKWGDSDCDCIESSDNEIMTLTVCNCYDNVVFSNFKIMNLIITDENDKPVPTLPNGMPSVQIHPIGPYCFGDIAPCTCVSREFVLINEGAKSGKYKVKLSGICFDIVQSYSFEDCFVLNICKD